MKKDCCWENIDKPKYVSRAYWVCPVCGKDISLMYCLYVEAVNSDKGFHKGLPLKQTKKLNKK